MLFQELIKNKEEKIKVGKKQRETSWCESENGREEEQKQPSS